MAPGEDDDGGPKGGIRDSLVVLQLKGQVLFPLLRGSFEVPKASFEHVVAHLEQTGGNTIGVLATRPSKRGVTGQPFEVGTLCRLVSHAQAGTSAGAGGARVRLVVEGHGRFRLLAFSQEEPIPLARVEVLDEDEDRDAEAAEEGDVAVRALASSVREKLLDLLRNVTPQEGKTGANSRRQLQLPSSPTALVGIVATTLSQLTLEERQALLEATTAKERLELALDLLQRETEAKRMSGEISASIQKSREFEMRQMVLQRQIHEVKKDLQRVLSKSPRNAQDGDEQESSTEQDDEDQEDQDEVARLAERLAKAKLPEEAERLSRRELKRLKSLQPHHPEYTSTHTYLELFASLPWSTSSDDRFDLREAKAMLDEDHKGLDKVKRRLLEFLAVQKMRGDMKGPILCLHGPPGIGKTSLGRSIARALGRKFHRIALGGVRDEAEIRGHRRTYIGSMAGSIIQAFQALGTNNPVILLDEVDKMAQNSMFNPQATLLEVLDPEQNGTFKDHYLNTPFDLSKALFVCTANDSSLIDRPLLDRMEVVELAGYTLEEKASITESHLLPKQRRLHALEAEKSPDGNASEQAAPPRLVLAPEAVRSLITKWTAESGVRNLERLLAQVCRWASLRLQRVAVPSGLGGTPADVLEREAALASCVPDANGTLVVQAQHLPHILGAEVLEPDLAERLVVGVAMGLSVSTVGGQLLFIEATRTRGSGGLTITGQLGKVMTESVETALSLLRSSFVRGPPGAGAATGAGFGSAALGRLYSSKPLGDAVAEAADGDRNPFKGEDVHVHFPAGGIPKDGPSAGVAVLLALASVLLDRPMRSDTAVTGEVTLRGHVLPVGGIRDKVLAAHRAGVKHVLLPLANKRNVLEDIPPGTLQDIQVHYMKHVDEALDWAFGPPVAGAGTTDSSAEALRPDLPPGLPAAAAASHVSATFARRPGASGSQEAMMAYLPPRGRL